MYVLVTVCILSFYFIFRNLSVVISTSSYFINNFSDHIALVGAHTCVIGKLATIIWKFLCKSESWMPMKIFYRKA